MLNSFIPKSWYFRQNQKALRPRVSLDRIERLENRDLPSASPLRLDGPKWADAPDVNQAVQNSSVESGRHNKDLQASGRWDKVLLGEWYVPTANLLAYSVGVDPLNLDAVGDQTIFQITSAEHGVFSGQNTVTFSKPTPFGMLAGQPATYSMEGIATRKGQLRIVFSSLETGDPAVTGVGQMQFVDGAWRMTMQMATGTTPYITHWAYMTKLPEGGTPPPAELPSDDETLRNPRYQGLEGTHWALTDSELFPDTTADGTCASGVQFNVDGYRNGYFWGTSPSAGSTPALTVVGSVTPRGNLFLSLTTDDGTTTTRTGFLKRRGGHWTMNFRAYESPPAVGMAREIRS